LKVWTLGEWGLAWHTGVVLADRVGFLGRDHDGSPGLGNVVRWRGSDGCHLNDAGIGLVVDNSLDDGGSAWSLELGRCSWSSAGSRVGVHLNQLSTGLGLWRHDLRCNTLLLTALVAALDAAHADGEGQEKGNSKADEDAGSGEVIAAVGELHRSLRGSLQVDEGVIAGAELDHHLDLGAVGGSCVLLILNQERVEARGHVAVEDVGARTDGGVLAHDEARLGQVGLEVAGAAFVEPIAGVLSIVASGAILGLADTLKGGRGALAVAFMVAIIDASLKGALDSLNLLLREGECNGHRICHDSVGGERQSHSLIRNVGEDGGPEELGRVGLDSIIVAVVVIVVVVVVVLSVSSCAETGERDHDGGLSCHVVRRGRHLEDTSGGSRSCRGRVRHIEPLIGVVLN